MSDWAPEFIDNKYSRCYMRLMSRAAARKIEGPFERHHVLPKAFGGSDEDTNIACLTFREHFIAHLLLTKMVSGRQKRQMFLALAMMGVGGKWHERPLTSFEYQKTKEAYALARRGAKVTEETRSRMRAAALARGDAYREKMSISQHGRIVSDSTKEKLSAAMSSIAPERRAQMAIKGGMTRRGRKQSPETIEKMRAAALRRNEKRTST
jgi:hypothetical protein